MRELLTRCISQNEETLSEVKLLEIIKDAALLAEKMQNLVGEDWNITFMGNELK